MKAYCFSAFLLLSSISFGQTSDTTVRRYDLNGNPIAAGSISESKSESKEDGSGRTTRTEYGVDANGRKIPLSSLEEMKSEVNGHVVTQQIIRRFDQNGGVTSTERVLSEEQKLAGGLIEKKSTVYRADLNGNEMVDQRSVTRSDEKTSVTSVEKRGFDGTLALAERQSTTKETTPSGSKSQSSTFLKDNNGNLTEVVKEVHETSKQGSETVENAVKYVLQGDGKFALRDQTVTRSTPQADGTVAKQIEVYGDQVPGLTNESGKPLLKEIQTVQSRKAADGSVVETTVSQRAEVTDNGRLGNPRLVVETVKKTGQ